jgi:hypothetical protein
MHMARNAFWGLNHGVDVRDILRKDCMHAFDHGVSEQMMKSTIPELHSLESIGDTKEQDCQTIQVHQQSGAAVQQVSSWPRRQSSNHFTPIQEKGFGGLRL